MDNNDGAVYIIIGLIAIVIWLFVRLKKEKRQREVVAKENSGLIADNALLKAEHLKFQLQPHTLKNILANLKVIAGKLNRGMESLSETLDYILYKGNTHLVSVGDEMNFIEKYLKLNDLFISEIDAIKFDYSQVNRRSKYFSSPCVPHLITAYFIENAFKHGDVNHADFLKIQLKLSDTTFEMNVVNKVRQKPVESKGGIGLSNMNERLDLLLTGKFAIKTCLVEQEYHSTLIITF